MDVKNGAGRVPLVSGESVPGGKSLYGTQICDFPSNRENSIQSAGQREVVQDYQVASWIGVKPTPIQTKVGLENGTLDYGRN